MSETAIRVERLGKQYKIGGPAEPYGSLRESLTRTAKRSWRRLSGKAKGAHDRTIWALHDVSFEVKRGEAIGIIGRNGAGKSTLLKVLSRITEPTTGRVDLFGRVGALLEVGTGFHPELTGRENIYLNGAILGMSRPEIRRRFDEITAFAEVERFIDTPVKRYSSGMFMRLAFAVAAHLEPEILVVDEVLAVGDAQFQKKCLGKMGEVAKDGRTVVFVSHNMSAIKQLCGRGVLLTDGCVAMNSDVNATVERYVADAREDQALVDLTDYNNVYGNQELRVLSIQLMNPLGAAFALPWDESLSLGIMIQSGEHLTNVSVGLAFRTIDEVQMFTVRSIDQESSGYTLEKDSCITLSTTIHHNLRAGHYWIGLGIASGNYNYYYNPSAAQLEVVDVGNNVYRYMNYGLVDCAAEWHMTC